MKEKEIIVFTDGSSRGNPGPGGWGAIIASDKNVYELAGNEKNTTNNRMELTAVHEALKFLQANKQTSFKISIYTDSQYFKNGFEKWMYGWQKNGWMTSKKEPVLNKDLWQELLSIKSVFKNLIINHVRGHVGISGNERADTLATMAADGREINLYQGPKSNYKINLAVGSLVEQSKSKGKAYCYLSMIKGEIRDHQTWKECQDRVRNISGAKFRRANSASEREEIISSWKNEKKTR